MAQSRERSLSTVPPFLLSKFTAEKHWRRAVTARESFPSLKDEHSSTAFTNDLVFREHLGHSCASIMDTHKKRHTSQKINPLYVVLGSTMCQCCGSVQPDFTKYILKMPQWDNSNTF